MAISKYKILTQAKESFSKSDFKNALEKFASVLQNYPTSKEAYNGVILAEMALSGEGGAEALFDYYEILKEQNKDEADDIMSQILQDIDGSMEKLKDVFALPLRDRLDYEDGILYKDFKAVLDSGKSFKETFENIMFSTKVIITEKADFLDFLDSLIENNFGEMALSYIESALAAFPTDKSLHRLLKKAARSVKSEA
ncbi:MAG: hypothetical protein WC144_00330 [Sulfurimonas sp.]|jgi:tetratricopeptide (TPR) repeat protein|nr:hypothetical protein [Sulfurimonadaceae bacterium]